MKSASKGEIMADKIEKKQAYDSLLEKQPVVKAKKRLAVVININEKGITLNVGGNGERIPFDPAKHSNLKKGDTIEI